MVIQMKNDMQFVSNDAIVSISSLYIIDVFFLRAGQIGRGTSTPCSSKGSSVNDAQPDKGADPIMFFK